MTPNLRSSSRATSNNSRPSTPVVSASAAASPSFGDSARPRKQRRTGRNSRIGVEVSDNSRDVSVEAESWHENGPQASSDSKMTSQSQRRPAESNGNPSAASSFETDWIEPPLRPSEPSYRDTPWAGVSNDRNPMLSTMRPLGAMPTAADLRRAGLTAPPKSTSRPSLTKNKTAKQTAREEPSESKSTTDDTLPDLDSLPPLTSTKCDVARIRSVIESALQQAGDSQNRAVAEGLRRLWIQSATDPFSLAVLDGVINKTPRPEHLAAFKAVLRDAYKNIPPPAPPAESEPMTRTQSSTSISSLSSAQSLESPKMTTTGRVNGTTARTTERGHESEAATSPEPGTRPSNENEPASKRTRLQQQSKDFPQVFRESQLRTSLNRTPPPQPPPLIDDSDSSELSDLDPPSHVEELENNDFCRQCNRSGSLLCCDGCVNSFHFSCLDPPLDPAHPPEGKWFCPSCSTRNSFGTLVRSLKKTPARDFQLPEDIRHHFQGVRTGPDGVYQEYAANLRNGPHGRGNKSGRADEQFMTRLYDNKGKLIVCVRCGQTSNGNRPIIQCDYCPCYWHLDCCDPPLANAPTQKSGSDRLYHNWMCPNHVDHELFTVNFDEDGEYAGRTKIRRPRHPRVIDVDVLPSDEEAVRLEEQESLGVVYRVSERGLQLDFINRVKRENLEREIREKAAAQYREYAQKRMDELTAAATEYYRSAPKPPPPESDPVTAIVNSRSEADREAIANLVSFATQNRDVPNLSADRTSLLIDALLASSQEGAPCAATELESLRALRELVDRRINALTAASR